MKFVHAADLHLDSPLRNLERYAGAPVEPVRLATRRALENLVALCIEEQAALLVIAGDLYDGDWNDYSTGLFFSKQMSRLREANVQVVWIRGNHDALSKITNKLRLPGNVYELPSKQPDSIEFDELGVVVHGQSYARPELVDDLGAAYPERRAGLVNIGLLHTALSGRPGHAPYAPCRLEELTAKGYDYFALGHVHQREELCRDPWVVFSGNLQGRHARETGEKGATVVSVEDGRIESVEHRALDVVRWARCELDVSEAQSPDDVVDLARLRLTDELKAAGDRLLAARLVIGGATRAHDALQARPERWVAELRAAATDAGGEGVWLEKVKLETRDPGEDFAALAARDDAAGELIASLSALRSDAAAIEALAQTQLAELAQKLPPELREGPDAIALDAASLRDALGDVERWILPRLFSRGEP